jgi:hypothetical protein
MEALRRAASDPLFAASSGLQSALSQQIPVSVLASNPYQVCREGEHAPVFLAGSFFAALFICGFPLLGLAAHLLLQRAKALQAAAGAGPAAAGAAQPQPPFRLSALSCVLSQQPMVAELAWLQFAEQGLVAFFSASVALSLKVSLLPYFSSIQGVCAGAALLACGCFLKLQPWGALPSRSAWKNHSSAGLYLLSAATAASSLAQFILLGQAGPGSADSSAEEPRGALPWALSLLPLLLAPLLICAILGSWLRSLLAEPLPQLAAGQQPESQVSISRFLRPGMMSLLSSAGAEPVGSSIRMVGSPLRGRAPPPGRPASRSSEPQLRPGWVQRASRQGLLFYEQLVSGRTQWEPPLHLPQGWHELEDEEGRAYFDHPETCRTQWHEPTAWEEQQWLAQQAMITDNHSVRHIS